MSDQTREPISDEEIEMVCFKLIRANQDRMKARGIKNLIYEELSDVPKDRILSALARLYNKADGPVPPGAKRYLNPGPGQE